MKIKRKKLNLYNIINSEEDLFSIPIEKGRRCLFIRKEKEGYFYLYIEGKNGRFHIGIFNLKELDFILNKLQSNR